MTITMDKEQYDEMVRRDKEAKEIIDNNVVHVTAYSTAYVSLLLSMQQPTVVITTKVEAVKLVVEAMQKDCEASRKSYMKAIDSITAEVNKLHGRKFVLFGKTLL